MLCVFLRSTIIWGLLNYRLHISDNIFFVNASEAYTLDLGNEQHKQDRQDSDQPYFSLSHSSFVLEIARDSIPVKRECLLPDDFSFYLGTKHDPSCVSEQKYISISRMCHYMSVITSQMHDAEIAWYFRLTWESVTKFKTTKSTSKHPFLYNVKSCTTTQSSRHGTGH